MKFDKIKQWAPFVYRYISYDNKPYVITFTCNKCGGHNAEKIDSLDKDVFWSGYFKCSDCGNKIDNNGNQICYYSDCFENSDEQLVRNMRPVDDDDVAEFCLKCEHRKTIYRLMDIPFCNYSRTTCARKHNKTKCEDYVRIQPKQLTLF